MALDAREVLLVGVRWSHALAAVALVGASAFCVLFLGPELRQGDAGTEPFRRAVDTGFKELLHLTLFVFVVSGGLLTFERLSSGAASTVYAAVLGIKVLLSVVLFGLAFRVRRGSGWRGREAKLLVGSGFLVILLATVLKSLYEAGLRP